MDTPPSTPKRKRPGIVTSFHTGTSPMTPSPQKLVDTIVAEQERCAANSPRTLVANRLGMLDMGAPSTGRDTEQDEDHDNDAIMKEDDNDDEVLRKKFKVKDGSPVRSSSRKQDEGGSPVAQSMKVGIASTTPFLVSDPRQQSAKGRQQQEDDTDNIEGQPTTTAKEQVKRVIKQPKLKTSKRPASPPPPMGVAPVSPAVSSSAGSGAQSLLSATKAVSDSEAHNGNTSEQAMEVKVSELTWHESEITGHLGLDPEDDGTGINGVGFKPTAQQTYARMQRRRQQVKDWREREGREARDRRREARFSGTSTKLRLDIAATGRAEQNGRRVVRFA